jgi:predicted lactoylglutathione lyase
MTTIRVVKAKDLPLSEVLITDDEPKQKAFYEALGFTQTEDFQGGSVRAFIRFD